MDTLFLPIHIRKQQKNLSNLPLFTPLCWYRSELPISTLLCPMTFAQSPGQTTHIGAQVKF